MAPVNDNIRYLLYNYDNLAYVSTLHSPPLISTVFMRTISDIAAVIKDKRELKCVFIVQLMPFNIGHSVGTYYTVTSVQNKCC